MDRQLATAVLWAVPAILCAPVVYCMPITWLGERDTQEGNRLELTDLGTAAARRPPAGWRDAALADPGRNQMGASGPAC
jgi:hypothetical protein